MNKKLAIKGHPTRGEEVIELLKMMGGKNNCDSPADNLGLCYLIDDEFDICAHYFGYDDYEDGELNIFTLEEFLEKYPYKIGDKSVYGNNNDIVVISAIKWDDTIGDIIYNVKMIDKDYCFWCTSELLKPYKETNMNENKFGTTGTILASKTNSVGFVEHKCVRTYEDMIFNSIIWHLRNSINNGKQNLSGGECEDYFREIVKKNNENKMKNVLAEFLEHIKTTPKDELEREFEEIKEWSNVGPSVEEFNAFCESVNKKPVYPKTFEECCKILFGNESYSEFTFIPAKVCKSYYKGDFITELPFEIIPYETKIRMLYKLLVCCDAYWKIAGEELGIDKPWEPDWDNLSTNHEFIKIDKGCFTYSSRLLVFPTEEMRDVFYENFKDLIESCKELL